MTMESVSIITGEAIYLVIITAAPVLLVSLTVGLVVSIFQTVTSIQEQTLTFIPKILAIFIALLILGGWMVEGMVQFMVRLWSDFSVFVK